MTTISDVTPAGLTKAEVNGLVAKILGLDVANIKDVAIVARIDTGTKSGFAFGGIGEPVDQGAFLDEALQFLSKAVVRNMAAEIAAELGIELPEYFKDETKEAEAAPKGAEAGCYGVPGALQ